MYKWDTLGDALGLMMEQMGMEDVDLFAGLLDDSGGIENLQCQPA